MHEGHGRTDRPGNMKGTYIAARTGSAGNRERQRVDVPKTVHQTNSSTGRSARPGNDVPMGMPMNPSHGVGVGRVDSSGVPAREPGEFQDAENK